MLVEVDPSGSTWQLRDTATGSVLTTVKTAATSGGAPFGSGAITSMDPQARHLYQLVPTGSAEATTPLPAALLSYDLRTGTLAGRVPLPQVHVESWPSWIAAKQLPVFHTLRPGIAIAPDGRTIAIVHADDDAITLIDAASLRVERTVPLAPRASLLRRLLGWLSLAPAAADAKGLDGTTLQAVFAADGRHLYVWGQSGSVDAKGNPRFNDLGLTLVDLDSGEIVAKALAGNSIFRVVPALDGKNLYVVTSAESDTLWRLDATTLAVEARCSFDQPRDIMVLPSVMSAG